MGALKARLPMRSIDNTRRLKYIQFSRLLLEGSRRLKVFDAVALTVAEKAMLLLDTRCRNLQ